MDQLKYSLINKLKAISVCFILSSMLMTASAQNFMDSVQYHGFITQGFTYTSNNNFYGQSSDHGSIEFTELGLNVSGRISNNTLASAQVISRNAGAFDDGHPEIDYAFFDITLANHENWLGGLRLGRTKNPYGLFNDSRDAAISRNGIFLPQSIYFDKVRDLILRGDGLQAYADINFNQSDLYFQYGLVKAEMGVNVENAFLSADFPGEMKENDPINFFKLLYEYQGGLIRLAYSKAIGDMAYKPAAIDLLSAGTVDYNLDIYSVEYNSEYWSLTTEYMYEHIDWINLLPFFTRTPQAAEGYYVQGTYRPRNDLELFLRYDVSHLNRNDKHGYFSATLPGAFPNYAYYTHDWTLGGRFDLTKDLMLRAEYHHIEGLSWISTQETNFSTAAKNWEMFNLLLSWHF